MNIKKFTQKSIETISRCEKLAYEYGNQQIEQEHLLYALLTVEDSLILKLIEKMGIPTQTFVQGAETLLSRCPKVQGDAQVYVGNELNKVLLSAEDEAQSCPERESFPRASVPVADRQGGQRDQGIPEPERHHAGQFPAGAADGAR